MLRAASLAVGFLVLTGPAVAAPGGLAGPRAEAPRLVEPVGCFWRRGIRYCSAPTVVAKPRRVYRPGISIRIF